MLYVLQKAPTVPLLSVGSPCFFAERSLSFASPGTCGHSDTSCQFEYAASIPSADRNGLSSYVKMYSPSIQQLGQYISLSVWNVVGSNQCISGCIIWASFLAMGSYSSGVIVLSVTTSIRRRGAAGECFLVEYIMYPIPRLETLCIILSVLSGGQLSRSSVMMSLPVTHPFFLLPFKYPPIKPPTSFKLSCWLFLRLKYTVSVSFPFNGVHTFCINSEIVIVCGCQFSDQRLPAVDIVIFLSLIIFTPR